MQFIYFVFHPFQFTQYNSIHSTSRLMDMRRYYGKMSIKCRNETDDQSWVDWGKKVHSRICILDMNRKLSEQAALNVISFRQLLIALEYCNVVQNQFSQFFGCHIFLSQPFWDCFTYYKILFYSSHKISAETFFPSPNPNSLFIVHQIFNGHTF